MEDNKEIIKEKVDVVEKTVYHYRYDYIRPYSSFAPEMRKVRPIEDKNQKTELEYVSSLNEFKNYVAPIKKLSNIVDWDRVSKESKTSEKQM